MPGGKWRGSGWYVLDAESQQWLKIAENRNEFEEVDRLARMVSNHYPVYAETKTEPEFRNPVERTRYNA